MPWGLKYHINYLDQETILFRKFNFRQKPEQFLNYLATGKAKRVQLSEIVYAGKYRFFFFKISMAQKTKNLSVRYKQVKSNNMDKSKECSCLIGPVFSI